MLMGTLRPAVQIFSIPELFQLKNTVKSIGSTEGWKTKIKK